MIRCITIALAFLISAESTAQLNSVSGIWGSPLHRAKQLYRQQMYEEAIVYFLKDQREGAYHEEGTLGLANSYWMIGDYEQAMIQYSIVVGTSTLTEPSDMFRYAESLMSAGHLKEAEEWYREYLKNVLDDSRAKAKVESIQDYDQFKENARATTIRNHPINTEHAEIGFTPYEDGYILSSSRESDLIIRHDHLRGKEKLLDIYYVEEGVPNPSPKRIKLPHHWRSNDGPVAIQGDVIVLTRNDVKQRNSQRQLGLYFARKEGTLEWKGLKRFEHNSKTYSNAHPALTPQTDTLFFSSNMPGGRGGYDLYASLRVPEGWGQPINLGPGVNTPGDEVFPFFHRDTLYFSSNGHAGLGGLDNYYVLLKANNDEPPTNLGWPANTGWDDFALRLENGQGYFSSNRPDGFGRDDLYEIGIAFPKYCNLTIQVDDRLDGRTVPDASIRLKNASIDTILTTNSLGRVSIELQQDIYDVNLTHPKYHVESSDISLLGHDSLDETIHLQPEFIFQNISLDSILFELDEFQVTSGAREELRNIINIMNDYPHLSLTISAHTDSQGKSDYNLRLSERRAESTAEFLISQGIAHERISHKGYGEAQLLNDCDDDSDCSDEEHAKNRRIEFEFVEKPK